MKRGIITYHKALNYGAALQCYGLYRYIKNQGVDVEIIDYECECIKNKYLGWKCPISGNLLHRMMRRGMILATTPLRKQKEKKFRAFWSKIEFSSKSYTRDNLSECIYDQYIIGSDQVWNYQINGGDLTYLLDFVLDKDKIATYACSFGLSEISETYYKTYQKQLESIKLIGVREKEGEDILSKMINRKVKVVVDPVFLFDKKEWVDQFKLEEKNKRILFYFFHKSHSLQAMKLLGETSYAGDRITKLAGGLSLKDCMNPHIQVAYGSGPLEFLRYIIEAKCIFTDSFHCVAMSIIFNKPFVVFLEDKGKTNSRIQYLLEMSGLTDRIYQGQSLQELMQDEINWDEVNQRLSDPITQSKQYLEKILS